MKSKLFQLFFLEAQLLYDCGFVFAFVCPYTKFFRFLEYTLLNDLVILVSRFWRSSALSGKMFLVRIVENKKMYVYFREG